LTQIHQSVLKIVPHLVKDIENLDNNLIALELGVSDAVEVHETIRKMDRIDSLNSSLDLINKTLLKYWSLLILSKLLLTCYYTNGSSLASNSSFCIPSLVLCQTRLRNRRSDNVQGGFEIFEIYSPNLICGRVNNIHAERPYRS
jgi:hypothetical protein